MTISAHQIARYQHVVRNMVADKGQNLKPKSLHKGRHCKPPERDKNGCAYSRKLRKAEARLQARRRDWATSQNSARDNNQNAEGYRKPGSMK